MVLGTAQDTLAAKSITLGDWAIASSSYPKIVSVLLFPFYRPKEYSRI